jgi:hypothetical protein
VKRTEKQNVIAAKRLRDEEVLREAERLRAEERAREEQRQQEAEQTRKQQIGTEAQRLRAAGFLLTQEVDGRPLWAHPEYPDRHFWHNEGLELLAAAERELAEGRALVDDNRDLPPAA